jgi:hypothetical protein
MNPRPRLTFANLAATVALVLAVGGSSVYASSHLGKNDVRSRNLAPGAVKNSDVGKNAATSPKIKNGTIKVADVAAGVLPGDIADITGSASGGPVTDLSGVGGKPVPLSGTTTFTPQPGQAAAVVVEAQFTIASASPPLSCSPEAALLVNGERTRAFTELPGATSATAVTQFGRGADAPFGLVNPGAPLTVTAQVFGNSNCTADSRLDRLEVRILQIH